MLFITLITLIICKALLNERLSFNYSFRITSIILLLTAFSNYNTLFNFEIVTGIGIYNGLFHITYITQIIEIFLLIIGSMILISWPLKPELITEISLPSSPLMGRVSAPEPEAVVGATQGSGVTLQPRNAMSASYTASTSWLHTLVYSISLDNNYTQYQSLIDEYKKLLYSNGNQNNSNIRYSLLTNNDSNYPMNYSILVLFCTLGASLLISCSDLISLYLSIELQSFSLYVLSTLYKNSEKSTSAGLKYFLLGALSSCLILFGAGLIYAYTGLTNLESIYSFLSVYSIEVNNNLVQFIYPFFSEAEEYSSSIFLGFIFIFVGFLFKISAAPFHNWSPDVYNDTPTIVTIWLTLIPKISILILLLELHTHIDLIDPLSLFGQLKLFSFNIDTISKNLLLISSLLSLIIGSVVGLAQNKIKRLLAYSTISHIGFILLALGIYSEQSIDSFIFYILQYVITNLNIFLIIIAFSYIINQSLNNNNNKTYFKDIIYISEFKGQYYSNPLIVLSFSICLFSMAGIPPLIGFFSKQYVLYSAIQSGYIFIALVAIFVSVISASYYLKIIKTFFIDLDSNQLKLKTNIDTSAKPTPFIEGNILQALPLREEGGYQPGNSIMSNSHSYIISTLTLLILFFIFKPSLILNITQLLSLSLFYI